MLEQMATVHSVNLSEVNGVKEEKGSLGGPDESYQENPTSFSLRRPSKTITRAPLSNGNNGVYVNRKSAQNSDPSQQLPMSESDSLLNLYTDSGASNPILALPKDEDQIPENMYRLEDHDPDIEKWIHRDKLARIEDEELQAAGFHLATPRATSTRRRAQSRDRLGEETARIEQADHWASKRVEKRPRVSSITNERAESPESRDWDLRTPEEIAATDSARSTKTYGLLTVRKSGSKIPILTSSPLPIPSERIDRDTPIPRKRNFSGSIEDDENLGSPRIRTRGISVGSQNLADETDVNNSTPTSTDVTRSILSPAEATPSAVPNPGGKGVITTTPSPPSATRKGTPAGTRKTSNTHKPRVPSNSQNAATLQHPPTRSTDPDRPRTAINRPEGEAPWLATMYKPDPRLPQDQQIIPTHAKKQQQQQQIDKNGFTHADHDQEGEKRPSLSQPSPSPPTPGVEKGGDPNVWPLKPIGRIRSSSTSRPGTGGSGNGGYSTMPKVISSPLNSPPVGALGSPGPSSVPQSLRRTPPPGELDKKKERSCGCCVVM
ncbi:hypothetical protein EPUS_08490 [Endocarpon pusillum Z07020]|uniref:Uncharacterized protein n=1 Tax=Endocarpon pusillum (strain Z07020 / HMAS-L-300199) TaxID=1263415 RepID=U1G685_ENDPU|nr:uncharacterized protein EPUS_08490 [Endocarpon pusillum Z07020]ERF72877.1 hypothetical protein EPUS_08490 [Endocarpon pusillum Z07020]